MKRTEYRNKMTKWNAFMNYLELRRRVRIGWKDYLLYMDSHGFLIE